MLHPAGSRLDLWQLYRYGEPQLLPDVATLKILDLQIPDAGLARGWQLIAQYGEKRRIPLRSIKFRRK